jgi:hypothetical protein
MALAGLAAGDSPVDRAVLPATAATEGLLEKALG